MSLVSSFRRRFLEGAVGFLAGAAALLLGCDAPQQATRAASEPAAPVRTLRLVSPSPAASQFLLALGAGGQIAGVDERPSTLPALDGLPIGDLAGVSELAPELILAPIASAEEPLADALRAAGHDVVAFELPSLEEPYALCRDLGARLVGAPRAMAFEVALSRELAQSASASFGKPRSRVAAVIGTAPLEFAGGTSVTHGGEELRRMRAVIEPVPSELERRAK